MRGFDKVRQRLVWHGLLNRYISARAAQIGTVALLCSVPPGRAKREPQGYAGLTMTWAWATPNSGQLVSEAEGFKLSSQQDCISLALRAPYGTLHTSEASCPNFEPRAHARLTGLTSLKEKLSN